MRFFLIVFFFTFAPAVSADEIIMKCVGSSIYGDHRQPEKTRYFKYSESFLSSGRIQQRTNGDWKDWCTKHHENIVFRKLTIGDKGGKCVTQYEDKGKLTMKITAVIDFLTYSLETKNSTFHLLQANRDGPFEYDYICERINY